MSMAHADARPDDAEPSQQESAATLPSVTEAVTQEASQAAPQAAPPAAAPTISSATDWADAQLVASVFDAAAQAHRNTPGRRGSTVHLPDQGTLIMSGDLHDHTRNFQRLIKLADLDKSPDRHLILHELIHGPRRINGLDMSFRILAQAAQLKAAYPAQVHLLLSNHEMAQMRREGILKDGVSLIEAFEEGLEFVYGEQFQLVNKAIANFIGSMSLAVRCDNGVLCSHSLPPPRCMDQFDPTVLDRDLTEADLATDGSAHHMVWGRHQTQPQLDKLAQAWNVSAFVVGHQPVADGYEAKGKNLLILASDHDQGLALSIDLAVKYQRDDLLNRLIQLSAVKV